MEKRREREKGIDRGREKRRRRCATYSKSDPRSNLVESLKSTPTLESESWYPRPYLSL